RRTPKASASIPVNRRRRTAQWKWPTSMDLAAATAGAGRRLRAKRNTSLAAGDTVRVRSHASGISKTAAEGRDARMSELVDALSFAFGMFWEVLWALVLGFVVSGVGQARVSK